MTISKSPMTHLRLFIIFSLAFIVTTSSQTIDPSLSFSQESSHNDPVDLHYLDACTAILQGFDNIGDSKKSYDYLFADWNITYGWFLKDYFENREGLVSMIYNKNDNNNSWTFDLMIYDDYAIDQKFAKIHINIEDVQKETYIMKDGTFATNKTTFTVYYGEYFQIQDKKDVTGEIIISFVNRDTNNPFTNIDPTEINVSEYTFQLRFHNAQDSAFLTTSFSNEYPVEESDYTMAGIYVGISVLIGSLSWYTRDLNRKVTLGNLQGFFAAASYMLYWAIIRPQYHGLWYWILLIPHAFNWLKLLVFIILDKSRRSRNGVIGTLLTVFVALLNHIPTVWMNLFPIAVLFLPVWQKMGKSDERGVNYMSRFEASNYLCLLLWLGYAYVNPGNLYLFEPKEFIFVTSAIQTFIQCVIMLIFQLGTGGYNQSLIEKSDEKHAKLNPDTSC